MIGVKITILLFVVTVISTIIARLGSKTEDIETKLKMREGIYPKYVTVSAVLILITIVGIIFAFLYVMEGGRRMINYTIPVMFRWLDWSKV